jgi:ATP-binding cassette subfamily F protein 3
LDGLVSKVYEFGGGKVREHIGGIYDFLQSKRINELDELGRQADSVASASESKPANVKPASKSKEAPSGDEKATSGAASYAERKEQQKRLRKAEKAVEASERKINDMEQRLKELDDLLMKPENASNMEFVTEYTTTKKALDEEVERWEKLSEELEMLAN